MSPRPLLALFAALTMTATSSAWAALDVTQLPTEYQSGTRYVYERVSHNAQNHTRTRHLKAYDLLRTEQAIVFWRRTFEADSGDLHMVNQTLERIDPINFVANAALGGSFLETSIANQAQRTSVERIPWDGHEITCHVYVNFIASPNHLFGMSRYYFHATSGILLQHESINHGIIIFSQSSPTLRHFRLPDLASFIYDKTELIAFETDVFATPLAEEPDWVANDTTLTYDRTEWQESGGEPSCELTESHGFYCRPDHARAVLYNRNIHEGAPAKSSHSLYGNVLWTHPQTLAQLEPGIIEHNELLGTTLTFALDESAHVGHLTWTNDASTYTFEQTYRMSDGLLLHERYENLPQSRGYTVDFASLTRNSDTTALRAFSNRSCYGGRFSLAATVDSTPSLITFHP